MPGPGLTRPTPATVYLQMEQTLGQISGEIGTVKSILDIAYQTAIIEEAKYHLFLEQINALYALALGVTRDVSAEGRKESSESAEVIRAISNHKG